METASNRSKAMFVHLSTFGQWFFPFGNFIFPLIIWSLTCKDSKFIDKHGREAINFQLSIFSYALVLALIAVPIFIFTVFRHVTFNQMINDEVYFENLTPENISGIVILAIVAAVLLFFLKLAEFFLVIYASVKAVEGKEFRYPLTISFLSRPNQPEDEAAAHEGPEQQQSGVQSSII